MNFTFQNEDGNILTKVYTCTECGWCSTREHCHSTEDGPVCVLCGSPCENSATIEQSTGMSKFKYRQILDRLEAEAAGVGSGTVENIEQHFDDGDDLLDAAEAAYREMDFTELEEVRGVGRESAKQITVVIADIEDWEDGSLLVL